MTGKDSPANRNRATGLIPLRKTKQPPFSHLRSPQRRPQAPHPKSKFLAAIVAEMGEADEKLWKEAQPFMGNAPMFRTKPFHEHSKKELVESGIPEWTPPAF
jgi:hypothetical protein